MSKKIARNSICPLCNSGLKYKKCCGMNEPIRGTSMRFIGDKKANCNNFEKNVFEALGHFPDDYINCISIISDVIYVLIDESNIDDNYAISGIVVLKTDIDKNTKIRSDLNKLVDKYDIDYVHFTEIFGRKKTLGNKREDFIKEYINLIKGIDLKAFAVCMNEQELKSFLKLDSITTEQCYIALTWIMMSDVLVYLIYRYGLNLIIEMWRENENITIEKRILHQENIRGLINKFPFANISIYRHYILFMKEEVLFSSLSDFIAYLTIGLYPKIKKGVSTLQLVNNYYDLLVLYNEIFCETRGMRNEEFEKLLVIVREREQQRAYNKRN